MDGIKKAFIKGIFQVLVFVLVAWILLSGSPNFSVGNFLLGTLIFTLGVIANIYLGNKA
ncbi:hypothetical protein [Enterococcus sp. AZ109]|uniref:hypothetical protein n=1 Tax=Enterococcus sp. AZ109 TaxID=2774634 RepID=UPI003F686B72